MMIPLLLALAAAAPQDAAPQVAAPQDAAPHADEVAAYAHVLAVAQVVSDRCADILVDTAMLEALRGHLHIVDADRTAVARAGRDVAGTLVARMAEATSPAAWCDAAYRGYGPDGDVLPRLMTR